MRQGSEGGKQGAKSTCVEDVLARQLYDKVGSFIFKLAYVALVFPNTFAAHCHTLKTSGQVVQGPRCQAAKLQCSCAQQLPASHAHGNKIFLLHFHLPSLIEPIDAQAMMRATAGSKPH